MTASEKLETLLKAVALSMALRGMPATKRPKDWNVQLRNANARLAELVVEYGSQLDLPELPGPVGAAAELPAVELPETPPEEPEPGAKRKDDKAPRKKRGGQHND